MPIGGHGSFGVAYDIEDDEQKDKILIEKITTHSDEYANALRVMELQNSKGGALSYCVYVHSARRLGYGVYSLIIEKVKPLSEEQASTFGRLFYDIHSDYDGMLKKYKSGKFGQDPFIQKMFDFVKELLDNNINIWDVVSSNVGLRGDAIVILDIGAV